MGFLCGEKKFRPEAQGENQHRESREAEAVCGSGSMKRKGVEGEVREEDFRYL